jgi:hypothetical protein
LSCPASNPIRVRSKGKRVGRPTVFLDVPGRLLEFFRFLAGRSETLGSVKLRKAAAISSIAGSVITRVAWVQAGKVSAADPSMPLEWPSKPDENFRLAGKLR